MKNYKLLLAGVCLLLLIVFIGVFMWLWSHNLKNTDPLPITTNSNGELSADAEDEPDTDTIATSILYLQAEDKIQVPLDSIIVRFESRYPKIQVLAQYVPKKSLLTLPSTNISDTNPSPFIVNTDIIIADGELTQSRLAPLQITLNDAQRAYNQSQINAARMAQYSNDSESGNADAPMPKDNNEARNLVSFSYALKATQAKDGVVLSNNPTAIIFRNFLISSTGQDILKQYGYENVDGYKSSVDDLFNPTSHGKTSNGDDSVEIAKALETK